MSTRPLISDSEKDKHKTREQLLKELSELRARLADKTEDLAGCERVVGMLDGITKPVLVLDDESQVVYANSSAAKLFAKDREAIGGSSLWELYPKSHDTRFYIAYEKARKARSTGKFQEPHRLLGKWFDVYLYPVPGGMTVLFNDITVSRQLEELPRLALTLLHNLKDNVFLMRADGRLFHVNNETQHSLGYSGDELHRMSIFDVVPSSYANEWRDILDRTRQHGSMAFESRLLARDGHEFPVEVYANFIKLYGSSYYTVSARDITERKRIEEALARSEKDFRTIVTKNADAMIILDLEGYVQFVNPRVESLYNLPPSDFIGKLYGFPILHEVPVEMYVLKEFKKFVAVETRMVEVEWRGKPSYLLSLQDITERKIAEEALRETRDYLESLIDFANAPIIVWDPGFTITRFNHAFERLSGYAAGEVVGKDLSILFPASGREESLDKIRTTLTGERWESVEIPILRKDGSVRIALWNSANIHNGDGALVATIAQGQDITDRKHAEDALQVAKAQAELYVDLMGHDINNMNQVAMASLEMALMDLEQDGKLDTSGIPLLERSLESLNNSSALIRNVQKLQRASVEGIRLQVVDMADVLKEIIDEQRSSPGKDVTIYYKNEATHCLVIADELLRDVFANILSNAIKHARTDRHLTIGVSMESVTDGGRKFCQVAIDDNGPGIPDDVKGRLFRRFSRGQTKAKGSGLGLYLVKTLVEHYGGDIRVEDRIPGDHTKGAKFIVTIPSSD
jgi:PAS domain S-box-containing protein